MYRLDLLPSILAVGIVIVRVDAHRTWTVERDDSGDVLEGIRSHRTKERTHRSTIELKDSKSLPSSKEFESLPIIEVRGRECHFLALVPPDICEAIIDHREIAQAEEIHLEQASGFTGTHVELGDDRAISIAAMDRDDIDQRVTAEDDASGMYAPLALETLETSCGINDLLRFGIALVELAKLICFREALVFGIEDAAE